MTGFCWSFKDKKRRLITLIRTGRLIEHFAVNRSFVVKPRDYRLNIVPFISNDQIQ